MGQIISFFHNLTQNETFQGQKVLLEIETRTDILQGQFLIRAQIIINILYNWNFLNTCNSLFVYLKSVMSVCVHFLDVFLNTWIQNRNRAWQYYCSVISLLQILQNVDFYNILMQSFIEFIWTKFGGQDNP